MSGRNLKKFINDNIVFLTGIPLIFGIHWGWWKIQQNPDLVEPTHNRELPIYSLYKELYKKVFGSNLNEAVTSPGLNENFKE